MVQQIAAQPTVRERYSARLIEQGVVTQEEAEAVFQRTDADLGGGRRPKASICSPRSRYEQHPGHGEVVIAVLVTGLQSDVDLMSRGFRRTGSR